MMRGFLSGALLLEVASSFRVKSKKQASGGEGTGVGALWTFGCPHVSAPALTNPQRADGCFDGYRVVDIDYEPISDDMDAVTMLLNPTAYGHNKQAVVKLIADDLFGLIQYPPLVYPCGWEEDGSFAPSVQEHFQFVYHRRAVIVPDSQVPNLAQVANVSLLNSYNHNVAEVASDVRSQGWGLVDTAVIGSGFIILGTEPSHLMQDPNSLRCLLTFEGSDDAVDFIEDVRVIRTSFCGLPQKVHSGFKSVVMEMVGSSEFQTKIRPQLQFCNKVDVMGHSLGGATASLFAACASNPLQPGDEGYDEYQLFGWTPATPKRLSYK